MKDYYPKRIVCLTEETTEMLYILGEESRIAGISGFTVRPPHARQAHPKVSAFTSAKIDKILDLKPDLVLGFSDIQADIAGALIKQGIAVHIFNQRSVDEIFSMVMMLASLVGATDKAAIWLADIESKIERIKLNATKCNKRPKVYFELWNDPLMSGIQWVSELIEIAGGDECFPDLAKESLAKNRIIADPRIVIDANPDIIIGSWCGRKFKPDQVASRDGWDAINAVKNEQLFEVKSANILQPGPAALTDGLDQLVEIIEAWQQQNANENV
ncbi:cobalamin-binding protein [Moritella marina ATCC 15381]|uniref:Cobalamin-binding protein n=1 Tax=Moritella marina ATCC 15381 TaxID=1202962 RepID=A0A5J6WIE4_MORMI|nr:cobalamin-binding protein [Moritella marina]QFI37836.1 cobalamin-binding protein [Moritella marina ATCC 15381]